eukprot:2730192-Rhodomonas_salina.3
MQRASKAQRRGGVRPMQCMLVRHAAASAASTLAHVHSTLAHVHSTLARAQHPRTCTAPSHVRTHPPVTYLERRERWEVGERGERRGEGVEVVVLQPLCDLPSVGRVSADGNGRYGRFSADARANEACKERDCERRVVIR